MRLKQIIDNIRVKAKMLAFYGLTCAIPIAVIGIMLISFNHNRMLALYDP